MGASAPPMFGRTVNPITTRGADYAHHSTTSPLKLSDLVTALHYVSDRLDGYIRVCFYEQWARMVNPQVFLHQFDIKRVYSAY